jgi:hypothetical protein
VDARPAGTTGTQVSSGSRRKVAESELTRPQRGVTRIESEESLRSRNYQCVRAATPAQVALAVAFEWISGNNISSVRSA